MVRRLLVGAALLLAMLYGALVLSGQGVMYTIRQTKIGPDHGAAGRLVGYEAQYFTGTSTFTAVYLRGFGAEDPPLMRKPPSEAEIAQGERRLAGSE